MQPVPKRYIGRHVIFHTWHGFKPCWFWQRLSFGYPNHSFALQPSVSALSERPGKDQDLLSWLPLHCAAVKANASTCSSDFLLTQAGFLVDWAHWSGWQSFSAAARVVNPDSMLWAMPRALEGPESVQVMPWVLGSAGGKEALWAPYPTAESPPGARSQPGASAAGDTGQGRESLGTQEDNVCFHRLCKDTLCRALLASFKPNACSNGGLIVRGKWCSESCTKHPFPHRYSLQSCTNPQQFGSLHLSNQSNAYYCRVFFFTIQAVY